MLALRGMDDAELCRVFHLHANLSAIAGGAEEKGERRMSKAALLRDEGLAHGDTEVGRVLARSDHNEDGLIDLGKFLAPARANSDLERMLRAKHLGVFCAGFSPAAPPLRISLR